MRRRLIIALALIFLLPLGGMGWLGLQLAAEEQAQLERHFEALLGERLKDTSRRIEQVLAWREHGLSQATEGLRGLGPDALRQRQSQHPEIDQLFIQEADGTLSFPDARGPLGEQERAFIERTRSVWEERSLLHRVLPEEQPEGSRLPASGWYAWHWGSGIHLLFWRTDGGGVVGAEVAPLALLAEIIAALPDGREPLPEAQVALRDARGQVLYAWGGHEPARGEAARARLALAPPLDSWHLEYFTPRGPTGIGTRVLLLSALLGLALVLAGLAFYAYRELTRTVREAGERVNFVNQVSHELKTPLTNIRLYAELLAADLDEDDDAARKAGIIVAETRRLSRLIGNVLGFARGQRGSLRLHSTKQLFDDAVREVIEQFRPGFAQAGIGIEAALDAPLPLAFDADAVAQIVSNLLSNVEKYAAGGGRVAITSRQTPEAAVLRVCDFGPGIPRSLHDKVFRPFYRIRDDLTEGVSGTGIGLSIARDLARLHGGDLRLVESAAGACFELTIPGEGR